MCLSEGQLGTLRQNDCESSKAHEKQYGDKKLHDENAISRSFDECNPQIALSCLSTSSLLISDP